MNAHGEAARRHLIRVAGWSAVLGALIMFMGWQVHPILGFVGALLLVGAIVLGYRIGLAGG